jgi:hypothetical protein
MSKEFATRNLVHNKIPEFPSGSGADRFLTKKEILDTSPFARIEGSYSDVAIPIMDNVIYAEAAFSVSRTSFQLPQNTGSESFTVTSTIGGEALAWSVSEFNASWATYSVSGNSVSVHANADQTTESQKSGYIRVKQSVTNQEITVNFTQAAGVPTYTYTFSPSTTSLSFGATANSQSISVTSYRTKYINGHQVGTENLDYSSSSPGGGLTVSGTTFSVTENVVESSRSWSVVFTQSVSGNTFTVSVTQAAASITWGHEFTSATTSLSFIATGETKRIAVNSIRRKYINGNPTTEVAAVPYTPSISGDSTFSVSSYDTSEIYIVAANNLAAFQRTGTLTLSQQSSGKTLTISLSQEARVLVFISVMFDGVQGGSPIIKWFTDDASGRIEQYTSENLYVPLGGELILDPQCEECEIHFLDDMDHPPVGISGNFSSSTDFENYRYTNRDGKVTGTIQLGNSYDEITLTIY